MISHTQYCIIKDADSEVVRGFGKAMKGTYYLIDESIDEVMKKLKENRFTWNKTESDKKTLNVVKEVEVPAVVKKVKKHTKEMLCHLRLGHAPMSKVRNIVEIKEKEQGTYEVCLTCPVAKFTKLPF